MLHGLNVFTAPPCNQIPRPLTSLVAYLHEGYEAWLAIYGNAGDLTDKHREGNRPESCRQFPE